MRMLLATTVLLFATPALAVTVEGAVVSKKKKYLPGTLVYVAKVDGKFAPPDKPVRMDQKDSVFIPKFLPIVKGTTVEYFNSDPTDHNVYSPDGEQFDLGNWGEGGVKSRKYDKLGFYTQLCKLHPAMLAYVAVLQNPYFALIEGKNGAFKIDGLPKGKYTLKVWNPRRKAEAVEIDATKDVSGLELKLKR